AILRAKSPILPGVARNTGFPAPDQAGTIAGAVLRRGLCVALLVGGWPLAAAAAVTMSPNPVDVGDVLLDDTGMATGTLSSTSNIKVDLRVTNNCSGTGAGTFTLSETSNINLNAPK